MLPENYIPALKIIVNSLRNKNINWFLIGSANLALQGVDVLVHDIDILTDKNGAYAIEKELKDYVVTPVYWRESETLASYYGKYLINDAAVEVMGELEIKSLYRSHLMKADQVMIRMNDFEVPCCMLENDYQAYLKMGRDEKAKKIKEFLDKSL